MTSIGWCSFESCTGLTDVYYVGTPEQWSAITIGASNDPLTGAAIHYNAAPMLPDLILPAALTEIGEEAFTGGAFSYVKLSEKTVSIGKNAFADCPNLRYIYIPAATESIDAAAFAGVNELTVYGETGSAAETYAQTHGFTFFEAAQ